MADGEVKIGVELDDSKAKASAQKTGNDIAKGVESGLKGVGKSADSTAKDIDKSFSSASKSAKSSMSGVGDAAKSSFGDVGDAARDASSDAASAFESIPSDASGAFADVGSQAQSGFGDVADAASSSSSDAASAFENIPADAAGSFSDTASQAESGFSGIVDAAESAADGVDAAFDGMGDSANGAGDTASGVFGTKIPAAAAVAAGAIAAVTAKVIDFTKESVDVGMGFDKAMSQVAATMGVTNDEIQELNAFAQEMGATTAFSATQSAEALNYMALAGYDASTSMEMLPTVLNLAAAGNMELATASDMVTDAQSALGLSLEETTEMVDKMAKASSKSNTSVEQLGNAFLTVGGTAKNLKGGTTELATALGILADNGIKGAEGGTALRNIILSLSAPTDKAADAIKELGVNVFDAQGNMRGLDEIFRDFNDSMSSLTQQEKTEALNTIFNKVDLKSVNALLANTTGNIDAMSEALQNSGVNMDGLQAKTYSTGDALTDMATLISEAMLETGGSISDTAAIVADEFGISIEDATKAVEAAAAAASESGDRFSELSGYIDDAAGSAQKMAETQLDNLAGDITLLQSATEGFQISISSYLAPALRSIAQVGGQAFSDLKTAWDESMAADNFTGAGMAIGQALVNVVNSVIQQIPALLKTGVELIGGFLVGIAQSLPSLISNIVSAVTSAIPLLIEAAFNVAEALVAAFPSIASELVAAVPTIIQSLADGLQSSSSVLVNGFVQLLDSVVAALPQITEALVSAVPTIITALANMLASSASTIAQGFVQLFSSVASNLPSILRVIVPMIPKLVVSLVQALVSNLPILVQGFVDLFMAFVQALPEIIETIVGLTPTIVSETSSALIEETPVLIDAFIQLFMAFLQALPTITNTIVGALPQLTNSMLSTLASTFGQFMDNAVQMFGQFLQGIQNAVPNILSFVSSIPSNILNALGNVGGLLVNAGRQIIQGFLNGLKSAFESVKSFVGGIGSWIAAHKGPKEYDLKLLIPNGQWIMKSLADGLGNGLPLIQGVIDDVVGILDDGVSALEATGIDLRTMLDLGDDESLAGFASSVAEAMIKANGDLARTADILAYDYGMAQEDARKLAESMSGITSGINDDVNKSIDTMAEAIRKTGVSLEGFGWAAENGEDAAVEMARTIAAALAKMGGDVDYAVAELHRNFEMTEEDARSLVNAVASATDEASSEYANILNQLSDILGSATGKVTSAKFKLKDTASSGATVAESASRSSASTSRTQAETVEAIKSDTESIAASAKTIDESLKTEAAADAERHDQAMASADATKTAIENSASMISTVNDTVQRTGDSLWDAQIEVGDKIVRGLQVVADNIASPFSGIKDTVANGSMMMSAIMSGAKTVNNTTVTNTSNFNQPVRTPYEYERVLRMQSLHGLQGAR